MRQAAIHGARPAGSDGDRSSWRTAIGRYWAPAVAVAATVLAGFLLYRVLRDYSMADLVASVSAVPFSTLAAAAGYAAASYACLTAFDYLGLIYAGRPLAYRKAALASFTSLSLGHSIGFAALSSGAVRYRFYSAWGLSAGQVARVILFCGMTVVLGLVALGGVGLLLQPGLGQSVLGLDHGVVVKLGIAALVFVAAYLGSAALVRGRVTIWWWTVEMPSFRLALGQLFFGTLNFALVAACLYQAVSSVAEVEFVSVAAVYVLANLATVISHVPGGLGVIESVVIYLLPQADLIGALLVFRLVYFLVPLALGGITLAIGEFALRGRRE